MKIYSIISVTSLTLLGISQAIRLAVLNDIHLNLTADPAEYDCEGTLCFDMGGMVNYDSPQKLFDFVLEDFVKVNNNEQKFDAIILSGDLVMHGLSQKDPTKPNPY